MVPATSIALSLDQQGLWCSLHCTIPNTNLYGYILFRGHPNSIQGKLLGKNAWGNSEKLPSGSLLIGFRNQFA